jgi:tellurite resistance protein TerC
MIESIGSPLAWAGFIAVVALVLAIDLGIFNRSPHVLSNTQAIAWSALWIGLSLTFDALVLAR